MRNVVKSQKFPSIYRKSMSLRTTVMTYFGTETQMMPILRMRKEKWPKTVVNAFRLPKFPSHKGNRGSLNPESNGVVKIAYVLFFGAKINDLG